MRNPKAPRTEDVQPWFQFVWQTPLGPMTGEVGAVGIHALRFPSGTSLRLDSPRQPGFPRTGIAQHGPEGRREGAPWHAAQNHARATKTFLEAYFHGKNPKEALPLDLSGYSSFDCAVWQAARQIGFGSTLTYGELAARIARAGATRAVGGALGRNPLVLLVPCHRVLARAGGERRLGGFSAGLPLKAWLLEFEQINTSVSL